MRMAVYYMVMVLMALTVCVGCKPSLPKGIISQGKMEDVLYDYHLAQSMASREPDRGVYQRVYEDAVLRKHHVTKEEFDASLTYYMRHTDELKKIYSRLGDRFKEEAQVLGISASDLNTYGTLSSTGDTANVWKGGRSIVLMPQVPFNQQSYRIKADTAFHAGDNIILNFDCNFIYQDGMRNGCAMLVVKFKNDSVASTSCQMSSTNHYSLSLKDRDSLGIKEVKGYFVLAKSQSDMESKTTLQLMFINRIQLIRMHTSKKESVPAPRKTDMAPAPIPQDTALKPMEPDARPLPPPRNGGMMRPAPKDAAAPRVINK